MNGHQQLNGHELEETPGDSGRQGSLASMGVQRIGQDLAIEQQKIHTYIYINIFSIWMFLNTIIFHCSRFSIVKCAWFPRVFSLDNQAFYKQGKQCLLLTNAYSSYFFFYIRHLWIGDYKKCYIEKSNDRQPWFLPDLIKMSLIAQC